MKAQLNMEDYFLDLAALYGKPAIVFFDRGVMDPSAYMDTDSFQALLDEQGWNKINLRDKRYDLVLHLVTAADGAEEFYTLANNAARYEVTEVDLLRNPHRANCKLLSTPTEELNLLGLDTRTLCRRIL
jgi:hypothetical protein